ncbi:MAG: hypothetical protein ACTH2Q_01495 [Propionibacteriaceae bacterium]
MGKLIFGAIALLLVVGTLVGVGVVIGGGWGAGAAGEDHTRLVNACIESNGGSVTKDQLEACIAEES